MYNALSNVTYNRKLYSSEKNTKRQIISTIKKSNKASSLKNKMEYETQIEFLTRKLDQIHDKQEVENGHDNGMVKE